MERSDFIGGTIHGAWVDDETNNVVVIVDTNEFGMQAFEATNFEIIREDDDSYDEET